jgi:hypothetical protein
MKNLIVNITSVKTLKAVKNSLKRFGIVFLLLSSTLVLKAQDGPPLGQVKKIRTILPGYTRVDTLQVNVVDNHAFYQGDICLGHLDRINDPQHGVIRDNGRWLNNTMPYVIVAGHPSTTAIQSAINHINSTTNLRLVPRTTETDYVNITSTSSGCWSYVGRIGGGQEISIGSGCGTLGIVAHEILHAAGMYHEQSREDRDTYVTINFANITSGYESNFNIQSANASDHGAYNYGSVMHYGTHAFSSNGQPTIVVRSPPAPAGTTIGQRNGLSAGDIAAVNFMYPSTVTCAAPNTPSVSSITTASATVTWTAVGTATAYRVEYKTAAASTWTTLANTTSVSTSLTGLSPSTTYNVRVYSICGTQSSAASTTASFTTNSATACTDVHEPNNSFAQARVISPNSIINGSITTSGDLDYFVFTTTAAAPNFMIDLGDLGADFNIGIYNSSQTYLTGSARSGISRDAIFYNATSAGTYYIAITGYNNAISNNCYRLTLITDASPLSCPNVAATSQSAKQ